MKQILSKILSAVLALGMILSAASISSASDLLSYDDAIKHLGSISLTDKDELDLIYNSFQAIGSRYYAPQYMYLTAALLELSGDENVDFDRIEVALAILKSNDAFVSEYMADDSLAYLSLEALLIYVNARKLDVAGNFEEGYEAYVTCQILDSIDRAIADRLLLSETLTPEPTSTQKAISFPSADIEKAVRGAINKLSGDIYPTDVEALISFTLEHESCDDISFLEHFTGLEILDLSYNDISDISLLAGLTNLTKLNLYGNKISDISPLAGLVNLTYLNLAANRITDISPMRNMSKLADLWLNHNSISDISPLKGLSNLTTLSLYQNNSISDISPLAGLSNLTTLLLSINEINDISPLAELSNLYQLDLYKNEINEISPLAGLTNLVHLLLSDNNISDISPLESLASLRNIDLEGNPVSAEQVDELKSKLPKATIYSSTPTTSPTLTPSITNELLDEQSSETDWVEPAVGDTVYLGRYEQDNDRGNGAEEIRWKVLAVENGKALLIAKNNLEYLPYNMTYEPVTWEQSSLRAWLNDEFIAFAFSNEETGALLLTKIEDDYYNGLPPGEDTIDRVFILSDDEVKRYMQDEQDRTAENSVYVNALSAGSEQYYHNWWWTRSPGYSRVEEDRVAVDGIIYGNGFTQVDIYNSVRPAMWIDISNPYIKSRGDLTQIPEAQAAVTKSQTISDSLVNENVTRSNLLYQLKGDGYSVVSAVNMQATDITILSELNGLPVFEIGEGAFENMKNLQNVKVPDSITCIKSNAFQGCAKLSSIQLSENLQTLGNSAFDGCTKLTELILPASLTYISDSAFGYCTNLKSFVVKEGNLKYSSKDGVLYNAEKTRLIRYPADKEDAAYKIPDTISEIGEYAIAYTHYLKDIQFPKHGFTLDYSVFYGSEAIAEISFPEGFRGSYYNAMFADCTNLVHVSLPSDFSMIGYYWFSGCTSLQAIDVAYGNSYYTAVNGVLYSSDMKQLVYYPSGKPEASFTVPLSVTEIAQSAFAGVVLLHDVYIGNQVTHLDYGVFDGDESVTIHCPVGSIAQDYAEETGMIYIND